jgi:hypothetical protein
MQRIKSELLDITLALVASGAILLLLWTASDVVQHWGMP